MWIWLCKFNDWFGLVSGGGVPMLHCGGAFVLCFVINVVNLGVGWDCGR